MKAAATPAHGRWPATNCLLSRRNCGVAVSARVGWRFGLVDHPSPDNVRARILAGVHARANDLLAERSERPIRHMTPHTLRRTFASIRAEVGVAPRREMYLLGHPDPRFTMGVFEQVFDAGPGPSSSSKRSSDAPR
jgi:hypothetical protein